MPTKERELPGDVYDALQMSAEAYGGIGAGKFYDYTQNPPAPFCYIGHLQQSGAVEGKLSMGEAFGIWASENDVAVESVNLRQKPAIRPFSVEAGTRIPFDQWTKELNVKRAA